MKPSICCALLLSLVACDVGEWDAVEENDELIAAGMDPCKNSDIRKKANVKRNAEGKYIGTGGKDIIMGTNGNDIIFGNGGDDLICAFDGEDYIDGGDGRDRIHAGPGPDIVHGRAGSDRIWGGAGNDILFGDTLDDWLYGEGGNDTLIGGHGTDHFFAGDGDDFMRGDTNNDYFYGDGGFDTVSFITALPPGQPEVKNDGTLNIIEGVSVAFNGQCNGAGCSDGDGANEPLGDIERVVGSAFKDRIDAGGKQVEDTFGETTPTPSSYVYIHGTTLQGQLVDVGVVVLGSAGNDNLQINGNGQIVNVVGGAPLTAGDGCANVAPNHVRCDVSAYLAGKNHRKNVFHFIVGWGGDGADQLLFGGDFPREFEVTASGGNGNDHLKGGGEQDIFFSGTDGTDFLEGNDGDDALISESHHTLAWRNDARPDVGKYNDGADTLDAGPGNDQLVADYVCGGHRYIGGPGRDIAGFARSGKHGMNAQLGGPARTKTMWHGKAANMELCGSKPDAWTTWRTGDAADLEVLESSDGPDKLWGDDRNNVLWGRGGGDTMYGLGGNDELLGADGNDNLIDNEGNNELSWGKGN